MKISRKISRFATVFVALLLLCGLLAGCGGSGGASQTTTGSSTTTTTTSTGSSASTDPYVYFLNFKPEVDAQWQALATAYTNETGVKVDVTTAASGQYETTLKAEMAKSEPPTLFQVNGPLGMLSWADDAYDLSGSAVYGELTNDEFALKSGSAVQAIAYVVESYGLIYNKALLRQAGYEQDDIMSFFRLRDAVNDITARKEELGLSGAFASMGMDPSSSWRVSSHLANLLVFHEYEFDNKTSSNEFKATFWTAFNDYLNLMTNNSTVARRDLATKTMADSVAEFVNEEVIFFFNGTWSYNDIKALGDDNLGFMPIYAAAYGEEKYGLFTGTENYWVVNNKASQASIDATLDFMEWCVTSDAGLAALTGEMGFTIPFKSAPAATNPLVRIADGYLAQGLIPMRWDFTTMPGENWKKDFNDLIIAMFEGTKAAADVQDHLRRGWAREYAALFAG